MNKTRGGSVDFQVAQRPRLASAARNAVGEKLMELPQTSDQIDHSRSDIS